MSGAIALALAAAAAWALTVVMPLLLPEFPPLLLSCARYGLLGLASFIVAFPALARARHLLTPRDVGRVMALALLGNAGFFVLFTLAIREAGVTLASLIVGLLPITLTLAGRPANWRSLVLPMGLVTGGTLLMSLEGLIAGPQAVNGSLSLGMLYAVGALASWTLYGTWNARFLQGDRRFDSRLWASLCGIASGVWGLLLYQLWLVTAPAMPKDARWDLFWTVTLLVSVIGSVVGGMLWNAASLRLPVAILAQCVVFETLCAVSYGHLLSGTWPGLLEGLSLGLLCAGMLWALQRLHGRPAALR